MRTSAPVRRSAAWLGLAGLAVLSGCGATTVQGMVRSGPIGRSMVVDARDERLGSGGVPGVTVKLARGTTDTRGGVAPLATAVTDEGGRFSLRVSDKDRVRGELLVIAEGEAVFRTVSPVYLPQQGQEILVQVRERSSASAEGSGP